MPPPLTPEDHEEVHRLYFDEGLTAYEIAGLLGISPSTARYRVERCLRPGERLRTRSEANKLLYARRPHTRASSEAQIDQMVYYYTFRRWSMNQIADHFYVVRSTVSKYLHERGVDTSRRTPRRDRPEFQKTVEMWEAYWGYSLSLSEVAEMFDTRPGTVRSRFKAAQLRVRTPGEGQRVVHQRKKREAERKMARAA